MFALLLQSTLKTFSWKISAKKYFLIPFYEDYVESVSWLCKKIRCGQRYKFINFWNMLHIFESLLCWCFSRNMFFIYTILKRYSEERFYDCSCKLMFVFAFPLTLKHINKQIAKISLIFCLIFIIRWFVWSVSCLGKRTRMRCGQRYIVINF